MKFSEYLSEGVADVYAQKEFGIPIETHSDFYTKHLVTSKTDIVISINIQGDSYAVIKNPSSLDMVEPNTRGIVDKHGNLFLLVKYYSITHDVLLSCLSEMGYVTYVERWHKKLPTEFITIQRDGNSNRFYIGESNDVMYTDSMRAHLSYAKLLPPYAEAEKAFQQFIDRAKKKNPKYTIENELRITKDF